MKIEDISRKVLEYFKSQGFQQGNTLYRIIWRPKRVDDTIIYKDGGVTVTEEKYIKEYFYAPYIIDSSCQIVITISEHEADVAFYINDEYVNRKNVFFFEEEAKNRVKYLNEYSTEL